MILLQISLTCSAKYTLFSQRPHCGVTPPHFLAGLGEPPPRAVPYLVPVEVCFSGVALSNDLVEADEPDRPSVAAENLVGLPGASSL